MITVRIGRGVKKWVLTVFGPFDSPLIRMPHHVTRQVPIAEAERAKERETEREREGERERLAGKHSRAHLVHHRRSVHRKTVALREAAVTPRRAGQCLARIS